MPLEIAKENKDMNSAFHHQICMVIYSSKITSMTLRVLDKHIPDDTFVVEEVLNNERVFIVKLLRSLPP